MKAFSSSLLLLLSLLGLLSVTVTATDYFLEAEMGTISGTQWIKGSASTDNIDCSGIIGPKDPSFTSTGTNYPNWVTYNIPTATKMTYYIWMRWSVPQWSPKIIVSFNGVNTTFSPSTQKDFAWVYLGSSWSVSTNTAYNLPLRIFLVTAGVWIDKIYIGSNYYVGGSSYLENIGSATGQRYWGDSPNNLNSDSDCVAANTLPEYFLESEYATTVSGSAWTWAYNWLTASNNMAMFAGGTKTYSSWALTNPYFQWTFTTSQSLYYQPNIRFKNPTGSAVKIWLSYNGLAGHSVSLPATNYYRWIQDTGSAWFPVGSNTLRISLYGLGVYIDKIALTTYNQTLAGYSKYVAPPSSYTTSDCAINNGFCDVVTTCTSASAGTCGSCPSNTYTGTAKITASNAGCTPVAATGCPLKYFTYALASSQNFVTTYPFTIEFATKFTEASSSRKLFVWRTSSDTSSAYSFAIVYDDSSGFTFGAPGAMAGPGTSSLINMNRWYHVAVVVTSSGNTVSGALYIDGSKIGSTQTLTFTTSPLASTGKLLIGGTWSGSSVSTVAAGAWIDEIKIWKADRSSSVVSDIPQLSSPYSTNLISYYTFDTCSTVTPSLVGSSVLTASVSDLTALQSLFDATGGFKWKNTGFWFVDAGPCLGSSGSYYSRWAGVDCDVSTGVVTSVNLGYNNLIGTIPSQLVCAPNLKLLMLQHNSLSGTLPPDVSICLTKTIALYLNDNSIGGSLPALTSLTVLTKLYLGTNSLSGSLPAVNTLTSLQFLSAPSNKIGGTLPTSLASLTVLNYLNLDHNSITGTLPSEILNSGIDTMILSNNLLSGPLPDRTTSTTNVAKMDFNGDAFSCVLPPFARKNLTFPLDLTGSTFYCPVGSLSASVTASPCAAVVLSSVSPAKYNVNTGGSYVTVTITGSGFQKANCENSLAIKWGNTTVPRASWTSFDGSQIIFNAPILSPQRIKITLLWAGPYLAGQLGSSALEFTYWMPCPNDCNCPTPSNCANSLCHGCCKDTISGTCVCKQGWEGPSCALKSCTLNCSYPHGTCNHVYGNCSCNDGYFGKYCQYASLSCPNACSGHGTCDIYTGNCLCLSDYWGANCSLKKCPPYSEPYCNYPQGTCNTKYGNCSCSTGWTGSACNIPIKTCPGSCTDSHHGWCDPATGVCTCFVYNNIQWGGDSCNVAQCPSDCSSHGTCNTTTGVCKCNQYYTTAADCSVKNVPCPNDCSGTHGVCNTNTGVCTCSSEYKLGPLGDCSQYLCPGNDCNGHGTCRNSTPICDCSPGWIGYSCSIPDKNCTNNCSMQGTCDRTTGTCLCVYPHTGSDCSLLKCTRDCSGHGTCNSTSGKCTCNAGWNLLPDCSLVSKDCNPACGTHGKCNQLSGTCVCDSGWQASSAGVPCSQLTCLNDCYSEAGHGSCSNGTCNCVSPYQGVDCSVKVVSCTVTCVQGACDTSTGTCKCSPGWSGATCALKTCADPNCNSHGSCNTTTGRCLCDSASGWSGPTCNINYCSLLNYCTSISHGTCDITTGTCNCNTGFYGEKCQYKNCPDDCSNTAYSTHGVCNATTGLCKCTSDWDGTTCSIPLYWCPNNCSGHGTCDRRTATCKCYSPYTSIDCSQKPCALNCSYHGDCDMSSGTCHCYATYAGTLCSYRNLTCTPNDCNGHGDCDTRTGNCRCRSPFTATADCKYAVCPSDCTDASHGVCDNSTGLCKCTSLWTGSACDKVRCDCNPRGGTCLSNRTCVCNSYWTGTLCYERRKLSCPGNCSNVGRCNTLTGVCVCPRSRTGDACNLFVCTNNCFNSTGKGYCNTANGSCICEGLHYGDDCRYTACPNNCSGHGTCSPVTGTCACISPWEGTDCSTLGCPGGCNDGEGGTCVNGKCSCKSTYKGTHCDQINWGMIVGITAGAGAALVIGSATGFFLIRRAAIKKLEAKKKARAKAASELHNMDGQNRVHDLL